jgi:oligosaccharide reducing-end xylanase
VKTFSGQAALLFCLLGLWGTNVSTARPDSGQPAEPSLHYRNLFAESGHSEARVRQRVADAFDQLFHGDAETQRVYFSAGTNANGPLAYMLDVANRDVRSEGMSYGMMISVQLDHKAEFDALWNWAKTFMYHDATNHPAYGYFSWSLQTNGTPNDEMAAPDGEEYFVTGLYFASGRWGNGRGIYNYRAEANRLLGHFKHRRQISGETIRGPRTGRAIFDSTHKMVRFTADIKDDNYTDPSYQLPAFYELWSRWGPPEDRAFWRAAAAASRDFFQRAAHPVTALCPEYAAFDGQPWASPRNRRSADFRFDAWRAAMNWSVDWAWWHADPREQELSDRLLGFFKSQGMTNYANQYTLAGKPLSTDHSPGLVAMNAVAALASRQPFATNFVAALWDQPVPEGTYRYYDGLLDLLGMLHCSGEFRIWPPQ